MADEVKQSGWLKKAFMAVAKTVTIGLVSAVAWQIFLDPLFFPIFHNTANIVAQAWRVKLNALFGWIPQAAGLGDKPGLLSPVMNSFLSDEIKLLTPPDGSALVNSFANMGGLSLDAIMP